MNTLTGNLKIGKWKQISTILVKKNKCITRARNTCLQYIIIFFLSDIIHLLWVFKYKNPHSWLGWINNNCIKIACIHGNTTAMNYFFSSDMIHLLLRSDIDVGDSLLDAIQIQSVHAVRILCNHFTQKVIV